MGEFMPPALDIVGQVMVELAGESVRIEALGDRVLVQFSGLRASLATLRRWSGGPGRRLSIRQIHDALTAVGVTVEVVVDRSTVGLLGARARAGLASRLMGFAPLEIRVGGVLGSLQKRPAPPE